MTYWILAATGFFGGLHCLGMCGPLALSLPMNENASWIQLAGGRILYNGGRMLSYASIGFIFGLFGKSMTLFGWQQRLSIVAGILLLIMGIYRLVSHKLKLQGFFNIGNVISKLMSRRIRISGPGSLLSIGILNGYLPCGLVYAAAAVSITAGGIGEAMLGMVVFGLGTFPVMMLLSMGRKWMPGRIRVNFARYSTFFALILGVLFILRGSNLNIPYVSPKADHHSQEVECCEPGADHMHQPE